MEAPTSPPNRTPPAPRPRARPRAWALRRNARERFRPAPSGGPGRGSRRGPRRRAASPGRSQRRASRAARPARRAPSRRRPAPGPWGRGVRAPPPRRSSPGRCPCRRSRAGHPAPEAALRPPGARPPAPAPPVPRRPGTPLRRRSPRRFAETGPAAVGRPSSPRLLGGGRHPYHRARCAPRPSRSDKPVALLPLPRCFPWWFKRAFPPAFLRAPPGRDLPPREKASNTTEPSAPAKWPYFGRFLGPFGVCRVVRKKHASHQKLAPTGHRRAQGDESPRLMARLARGGAPGRFLRSTPGSLGLFERYQESEPCNATNTTPTSQPRCERPPDRGREPRPDTPKGGARPSGCNRALRNSLLVVEYASGWGVFGGLRRRGSRRGQRARFLRRS